MNPKLLLLRLVNRLLMRHGAVTRIPTHDKDVYLTFDDGSEPGITEFVLNELDRYGFKATFFCKGKNAESYPNLMRMIKERGHAVGNHTYEHIHAYERDVHSYMDDVERADDILQSRLFRPPNGCLRLTSWLRLRKKYNIVYWTIGSGDWQKENFDLEGNRCRLEQTKSGDIILFHFCDELQSGTRRLFPWYLAWLNEQGFTSKAL